MIFMEKYVVRIDKQGRFVIPASIRKMLGIKQNSELELWVEGRRIIIEPKDNELEKTVDSWFRRMINRKITIKKIELKGSKWMSGDYVARKIGLRRSS